ncbi:hypothetical protein NDU88_000952 [Pleurodeles waltl]|uniref:Uncharacterized protein n=1 Tax=Pleurodeles waltl TaxID=8319 RepID=A0AAV7NB19_PLEWA|nr:hypothetical protein NDU88_000952 [Pleurodeles waltl]
MPGDPCGTEGRKLATRPRPTKPARGVESRLREAGDGAPATPERQLSRPRGLREPLRPAPACPQRRKYTRTLGRRHREVRSPRRLGEELSQRGRTEPLGDGAKRQVRHENTIRGRGTTSPPLFSTTEG